MTTTRSFNIGDVVALKTGGPKMTVVRIWYKDVEMIRGTWFAADDTPRMYDFPADAVEMVEK